MKSRCKIPLWNMLDWWYQMGRKLIFRRVDFYESSAWCPSEFELVGCTICCGKMCQLAHCPCHSFIEYMPKYINSNFANSEKVISILQWNLHRLARQVHIYRTFESNTMQPRYTQLDSRTKICNAETALDAICKRCVLNLHKLPWIERKCPFRWHRCTALAQINFANRKVVPNNGHI